MKKSFLTLELCLFLVLVPLLAMQLHDVTVRRFLLWAGCLYAVIRLRGHVSWRFLIGSPSPGWWRGPLLRGGIVAALVFGYTALFEPDALFSLPRQRPLAWAAIMALYPLLSAVPQEIIFRVYLFEVHRSLWGGRTALPVFVSALLFGWVHVVYAGWFAVLTSAVAGIPLSMNYAKNRAIAGALIPLALEHSLYGCIIFTAGLDRYFFLPR